MLMKKIGFLVTIFTVISAAAAQAAPKGELQKLELDMRSKRATLVATCETFLMNGLFTVSQNSPITSIIGKNHVIEVVATNDLLEGYGKSDVITIEGDFSLVTTSPMFSQVTTMKLRVWNVEVTESVRVEAPQASGFPVKQLPAKSELRALVEPLAEELRDGNISNGRSLLSAGKLDSSVSIKDLATLSRTNFNAEFKERMGAALPEGVKLKTRTGVFAAQDVEFAAKAIEESGFLDVAQFEADFSKTLEQLGDELQVLITSAKVPSSSGSVLNVYSIAFLNPTTREIVRLFAVEDNMGQAPVKAVKSVKNIHIDKMVQEMNEGEEGWKETITDGGATTEIHFWKVNPAKEKDLESYGRRQFPLEYHERMDEALPVGLDIKVKVNDFTSKDLDYAVKILNEAQGATPESQSGAISTYRRDLVKVLAAMGDGPKKAIVVKAKVPYEGDRKDKRDAHLILFIDMKSGAMVRMFAFEGRF